MFYWGQPQFYGVRAAAANLGNSAGNYTAEQFQEDFPQFFTGLGESLLPRTMLDEVYGEETKKAPTQDGERGIDEQNLKVAFFRGADPTLTDEEIDDMWDDAKDLRDLLIMKKRRERDGK